MELKSVVVCPPAQEYFNVENLNKHNIKEVASKEAIKQHETLVKFLKKECEVHEIKELQGHPNSVFVRDAAIVTPCGYIKVRMGLESRRGEEEWMASFLESLGIEKVGEIKGNASCEGGDIILAGDVAFIGHSTRTNEEGVEQLKNILESIGYEVRIATVAKPFLHLGGMMSIVGNTILHCHHGFPDGFLDGFEEMTIECNSFIGGNVIYIQGKEVIVEERNKEAIKKLQKHEFNVHVIDLSEFIKGNGGPSCLILPLKWG
ncbi:MAG: amidinotransferase [Thermoplasmata archaeon]|nr:amidinotransferase [Thermoplasmata archaeon]